jgi:hypothetical protein
VNVAPIPTRAHPARPYQDEAAEGYDDRVRRSGGWVALVVAGLPALASAAHLPVATVEVPAGALPPGPAMASVEPRALEHFRYQETIVVRAGQPAHLRLPVAMPGDVEVVVRGAGGALWRVRTRAVMEETATRTFVGTAGELGQFGDLFQRDSGAASSRPALLVVDPTRASGLDCDTVRDVPLVSTIASAHLLDCAAAGAHLILVGTALERAAPGLHHPWGLGSVGWAQRMEGAVALYQTAYASAAAGDLAQRMLTYPRYGDRLPSPVGPRGVLLALAAYLALVVVCGLVVSRRPRRPLVTWGWFPAASVGATVVVALVGLLWHGGGGRLELVRASVLAPSGAGTERVFASVQSLGGRVYSLRLPWRDALLADVARPHRYGSPFRRTLGVVRLHEDREAETLQVDELAVNRMGDAGLTYLAPARRPTVRVERRGAGLWLVNTTGRPIDAARFCSREASIVLLDWKAGQARTVPAGSRATGPLPRMPILTYGDSGCGSMEADAFALLATGSEEPPPGARVDPPLPVTARWVELMLGPLPPPEGGAP